MNDAEALFKYRREQAFATLSEAQKMFDENFSSRSIINRSYYAMFYMVLALFLKKGISFSTSKHTGIMSLFDKEFILTDILDRAHSKALHKMFDRRLEFDYKDFVHSSMPDAQESIIAAEKFLNAIEDLIGNGNP